MPNRAGGAGRAGRERQRPERGAGGKRGGAAPPSESERGWGPASIDKRGAGRAGRDGATQETAALSHVDARGRIKMVDVGQKAVTVRHAVARGSISMSRAALDRIRAGAVKKGDPLQAARLAGIMAAKQTAALIPLCHP